MTPKVTLIQNVNFGAVEVYDQSSHGSVEALEWITVGPSGGDAEDARARKEVLTEGEVGGPDELRPVHQVRREFDPPQVLRIRGKQTALPGPSLLGLLEARSEFGAAEPGSGRGAE